LRGLDQDVVYLRQSKRTHSIWYVGPILAKQVADKASFPGEIVSLTTKLNPKAAIAVAPVYTHPKAVHGEGVDDVVQPL
jgi:hypothetical protein